MQFKFSTIKEACDKAIELLTIEDHVELITIVKSLEGGLNKGPVVYYVEDEFESGFVRAWESRLFEFEYPYIKNSERVSKARLNTAIEKLRKLSAQ